MKPNSIVAGAAITMGAALAAVAASSNRAVKTVADKAKSGAERVAKAAKKVTAPKSWPFNHPHVNPYYRERQGGVRHFIVGRTNKSYPQITAQDVGRWMPHNGAREMARRVRQREARANAI